jgi:lipoprotein-anchoring transpeptidase ErfK/SrfK
VTHPWSDFSQSPSLNDQRRIATTELPIGVKPAEPGTPSRDAAPQPAPVNQTTLVPFAKNFELMRQLEALAHEVALVSRGDPSNQRIKFQEGSHSSAGLQLVQPSIRVSPRDHLTSDSRPFGGRTNPTPVGFFTATRDRLVSYRPPFGRPSATLANFFIAARDQLASCRPSIDRRTFLTLAIFITTLIGVAAMFVWQTQRVSTAKSPNDITVAEKQSGVALVGQVPLQNSSPQPAPVTQTAPAPTAPAAAAQEQLAAKQEQIDQNIAKPQAVKRDNNKHARETVRLNGYSAGTIVIKTNERHLYYVTGGGQAIRYWVGVGKAGMAWTGQSSIDGKYISPAWQAPESIRKDYSRLPPVIPGGSPSNPMGAAALTLSGGGQYAIHGTNNPGSIGGFVSHGCIRMYNQDIMDLYARVSVGTKVVVLR